MLFSRSTSLWIALAAPFLLNLTVQSAAFAGDDFDDLPDEDLEDEDPPEARPSAPASGGGGDGFDFGEDPEWDDAPPPVAVPKGLDEDPEEARGKAAPKDDFLEDDPLEDRSTGRSPSEGLDDEEPSDVFRAAPRKDTFLDDEDPVEIVRPPASAPIDDLPPEPKSSRAVAPVVVAAPVSGIGVETKGKRALSDNFPAVVVGRDLDAVVVELPILVANKPSDHKADYWLIVDVMIADRKVGEQRYWVAENTIAELGPTLVWCKAHVPVSGRTGKVRLKVSKVVGSADPSELFVHTVDYAL